MTSTADEPIAARWRLGSRTRREGERRQRYVLCMNPQEAERQRQHREQVLAELEADITLLDERDIDHPKAACRLMASRR